MMSIEKKITLYSFLIITVGTLGYLIFLTATHPEGAIIGLHSTFDYIVALIKEKAGIKLLAPIAKICCAIMTTVIFGGWLSHLIARKVSKEIADHHIISSGKTALISKLITVAVYLAVAAVCIGTFGIDIKLLSIFGGALGVGIGFGLQKIASNFISGIIILFEGAVEIGDLIKFTDGSLGYIRKIRMRYTVVETLEGHNILVPNDEIITARITNLSHSTKVAKCTIEISVDYKTDIKAFIKVVTDILNNYSGLEKSKSIECAFKEFTDSAMKFSISFWVQETKDTAAVIHKTNIAIEIVKALQQEGIEIPPTQIRVRMSENNINKAQG